MKWPIVLRCSIGERQWVTIGIFAFATLLLAMSWANPGLWKEEVFKVILQAVVLTGMLNMVLAFHFASNKGSETSRENTGAAFRAIEATATGQKPSGGVAGEGAAAQQTADAAQDQADEIKGDTP